MFLIVRLGGFFKCKGFSLEFYNLVKYREVEFGRRWVGGRSRGVVFVMFYIASLGVSM